MSKFHDEFFRKKTPEHDQLTMHYVRNIDRMIKIVLSRLGYEENVEYESYGPVLEKICYPPMDSNGNRSKFIIGYIDIVHHIKAGENRLSVVVEIKPSLPSWGGPIRQLKTYMTSIKDEDVRCKPVGVLVSYDDLSLEEVELLETQNVYFIRVDPEEEAVKDNDLKALSGEDTIVKEVK